MLQTQRPPSTQVPWMEEMDELSLQVRLMPTVQVDAGPTQPYGGKKQPFGHTHTATAWLLAVAQPHAPVVHRSGKSEAEVQHSCADTWPPVAVHRLAPVRASVVVASTVGALSTTS